MLRYGLAYERLPEKFKEKIHTVISLSTTLQPSITEQIALAVHLSLDWPLSVSWNPL